VKQLDTQQHMSAILQRFQDLTSERERVIESETEARGYPTSDGYVHEVVSRSPNRQTVTKRVTVTQSGGDIGFSQDAPTAPKLRYHGGSGGGGGSEYSTSNTAAGLSSAPLSSFEQRRLRPLPSSVLPAAHPVTSPTAPSSQNGIISGYAIQSPTASAVSSPSYPPVRGGNHQTSSPFTNVPQTVWQQQSQQRNSREDEVDDETDMQEQRPREVESLGRMCWVSTTPQRRHPSATRRGGGIDAGLDYPQAKRGVRIGGAETTIVEPSRISPLLVKEAYAPVRYMSKRQLREMRGAEARPRGLHVRQSSVPRLDAWMEEQQRAAWAEEQNAMQGGSLYNPSRPLQPLQLPHGGREFWPNGGEDEPVSGVAARSGRSTPNSRTGSATRPVGQQIPAYRQLPPEAFDGGAQVAQEDLDDERWDSISQRSSQYAGGHGRYNGGGAAGPYAMSPQPRQPQPRGFVAGTRSASQVTTIDHLPNTLHVVDMAEHIAFARRVTYIPQPPPHCQDAFRLLFRGTYLIKYGRQGPPHERFVAMRLVESERSRQPEPFLVWATHAEAASFKERIHLALLVEVVPGLQSPNNKFLRHLISNQTIAGPSLGGKKSILPTLLAFTLVFAGGDQRRTLDCLCLDEQTYHCWLMVCQYFASVNKGGQAPIDVETMAPDTPRSMSAAR
jgi:hypothetical protein